MSTARGFTLRVIGSQSVSEPFRRERGVGQGRPLAPLLFALAIEPLSRMLKLTMSGMHINHIHVKQDTRRTVVAIRADDTTIFAGGPEDTAHAKEAIRCDMDASSASINWDKTTTFLCGNMLDNAPPPDTIPGTILGPKDKTRYLGVIISRDPDVAPWENALGKGTGKTEGMEQEEPVHPQSRTHCVHHDYAHCGLCAVSSTSTNTCTAVAGEESDRVPVGWC